MGIYAGESSMGETMVAYFGGFSDEEDLAL